MLWTRRVFLTALGAVFAVAFGSLWLQIDGLLGSRGILPAAELVAAARAQLGAAGVWQLPSLCWLACSDAVLHGLCAAGVALSCVLAAGFAPTPVLALLWLLYLSLASVGGVFLGYQWDVLLLETAFAAALLAPRQQRPRDALRTPVPRSAVLLLRWLVFRVFFQSGVVKLASGDPTWRNLSALEYHYFTQPLPAWTSWFAHQLPPAAQRASAAASLAIELLLPFLVFGPRSARLVACAGLAALQILIGATGNYGFFNLLALTLCLMCLDDRALAQLLPRPWRARLEVPAEAALPPPSRPGRVACAALALAVVCVTGTQTLERLGWRALPGPLSALLSALAPWRTLNGYGLFAVMTTRRPEIVLEGSRDGREWRAYELPYKPGDPRRAPRFAQPHQPRLDWQLWFAALRGCEGSPWFARFAQRLLEGSPSVVGLCAGDPFPGAPPRYLRSTLYEYRFAGPAQRRAGTWWVREPLGPYCPPLTLRGGRLRVASPLPLTDSGGAASPDPPAAARPSPARRAEAPRARERRG